MPVDFFVKVLGFDEEMAIEIIDGTMDVESDTDTEPLMLGGDFEGGTEEDRPLVIPEKDLPDYWTINEKRRFNGLIPIPGGDAIMLPSTLIPALEFEEEGEETEETKKTEEKPKTKEPEKTKETEETEEVEKTEEENKGNK